MRPVVELQPPFTKEGTRQKTRVAMALFERWNVIQWEQASAATQDEFLDWADEVLQRLMCKTDESAREYADEERKRKSWMRRFQKERAA